MKELAFKFVTVTNPDEIKDPTTQRAIRQHARRRANGNSVRQKSFKLVFDLPAAAGVIGAGPERQLVESGYVQSAEQEHSDLNDVVPSIHPLWPINIDTGTISGSSFSPEIKDLVENIGKNS